MKTRPFNLEEALAGKPVVTRDGQEVTQITLFEGTTTSHPVFAVLEGDILCFNENGMHGINSSSLDLFMKVRTMTVWVNLYPDCAVHPYTSKEDADKSARASRIECREVTWEVGGE